MAHEDNKRHHVCFVISSLANEGPTRVLLNIVKYIDLSRFSFSIFTLVDEKERSLAEDFQKLGARILFKGLEQATNVLDQPSFFDRVRRMKSHIASERVDLLHCHCPRSLIYVWWLGGVCKTVYTAHIYPGIQTLALYGPIKGRIVSKMIRIMMKHVGVSIACSESVAHEYLEKDNMKIPAVNNGIEPRIDLQRLKQRDELRSHLGLDPHKNYFLYIGRLSSEKRPVELARAFSERKESNCQLVMIGEGPEHSKLIRYLGDKVRVDGFKSDISPYLAACDYYISSSKTEGLANTLLEAMSAGLPILVSDIPSHRMVVQGSPLIIGRLFDADGFKDFEQGISYVLKLNRREIAENTQKEFYRKYTVQTMTKGYECQYERLLNE